MQLVASHAERGINTSGNELAQFENRKRAFIYPTEVDSSPQHWNSIMTNRLRRDLDLFPCAINNEVAPGNWEGRVSIKTCLAGSGEKLTSAPVSCDMWGMHSSTARRCSFLVAIQTRHSVWSVLRLPVRNVLHCRWFKFDPFSIYLCESVLCCRCFNLTLLINVPEWKTCFIEHVSIWTISHLPIRKCVSLYMIY